MYPSKQLRIPKEHDTQGGRNLLLDLRTSIIYPRIQPNDHRFAHRLFKSIERRASKTLTKSTSLRNELGPR